ncbi:MAG TPA: MoxR family ATPase [Armatimonadota bacterium]|nr:MoxR family ATPase [Armatimonadota bacterium]
MEGFGNTDLGPGGPLSAPPLTPAPVETAAPRHEGLDFVQEKTAQVFEQLERVVVGQEEVIRALLVAIYTQGHALLEGVPGTAKTLMVRALARAMNLRFSRIQFTPDLMPSDVVGTNIFDMQRSQFTLRQGPVFTDLLLADEINRSPAKTQAALLEAMQERRCTIDGAPYELSDSFTVFATQNPIEYEGTYPLPEAQLDRFMMKVLVSYPHASEEERLLERYNQGEEPHNVEDSAIQPVMSAADVERCRQVVKALRMKSELVGYIRRLITATRESDDILVGAGPRGGIHLLMAAKATAAFAGRDFATPDDIQSMVLPTLRHRIVLQPEAEASGLGPDDVLRSLLQRVEVPR